MPYITSDDRVHLEMLGREIVTLSDIGRNCRTSGELNYTITRIIHGYFKERGGRYQQVNDIVGALEGAKLEFYRKIVAPYEEIKEKENGSV